MLTAPKFAIPQLFGLIQLTTCLSTLSIVMATPILAAQFSQTFPSITLSPHHSRTSPSIIAQSTPSLSAEQTATMEEASRLYQQGFQLFMQGDHITGMFLAEQANKFWEQALALFHHSR